MKTIAEDYVLEACGAFPLEGQLVGAVRYGQGHINDTFCVYLQTEAGDCLRYIMQRINTDTFKDPDGLMENIVGVTDFLRDASRKSGGNPDRETMTVVRTKDGKNYYRDSVGSCWRVYPFVENTVCLQSVEKPEQFYESARAFGNFQRLLSDFDASKLHETIYKFHDTRNRYKAFEEAVLRDAVGRSSSVQAEIDFVRARIKDVGYLMDKLDRGELPLRVTHNDTKLNNVLLDKDSGKGIVVIDLDTVMPGLSLHDYGDSIRFGANTNAEDEPDLAKVNFSQELFDIYTKGFLETAGASLTKAEKDNLPWGARLMTLECGIRFLTDHLDGDKYFRTHRPNHNLDRARTQFKLVQDMEAQWDELNAIVAKYI
ncbi:MAG: aminoglycoside phosphotransferase family protein [Clostridia bacterium]|nr:aminoglycoside phosphotransferase family protein [Clostridia bacterium]